MKILISIAIFIVLDIMMIIPVSGNVPFTVCVLIGLVNGYVGVKLVNDLGL